MKLVHASCGVTLAIGLFFIFVWAPHPWGWEGFDHYHQLALSIATGQGFPTMEVPWGYAYFLAVFYRLFGDRPWIPLLAQALLNATIPFLVYRLARGWMGDRIALTAAAIAAVFSFNTIYASTQSSDAVCTIAFMTALVLFEDAQRRAALLPYAAVGLLGGLIPQFRPNLILLPLLLAAFIVLRLRCEITAATKLTRWTLRTRRPSPYEENGLSSVSPASPVVENFILQRALSRDSRRAMAQAGILLLCSTATLLPWVVRNYQLTRTVLPTSVHGGVQLWYGTLQVGPYLHSRAYSPRAVFETPVFPYTSLDQVPLIVAAMPNFCAEGPPTDLAIVYWTDRDRTARRLSPSTNDGATVYFEIPPPERTATIYYYFTAMWRSIEGGRFEFSTPPSGSAAPFLFFVGQDHLGDLDREGDLLDVFDLVRIARYVAWKEPLRFADQLTRAGIGPSDLARAVDLLGASVDVDGGSTILKDFAFDGGRAVVTFRDGSSLEIPRAWKSLVTDLTFRGATASALMHSHVSLVALSREEPVLDHEHRCAQLSGIAVNEVFYRKEPHQMRRYSALAFDNIRRAPVEFVLASAYRALRLFVVQGSDDPWTAQQFSRSGLVYGAAALASWVYVVMFACGVAIAWQRGFQILIPMALILYVPLTIAPVLTNMRYSITVQPLMFMFVAVALTALYDWVRPGQPAPAGPTRDREGS